MPRTQHREEQASTSPLQAWAHHSTARGTRGAAHCPQAGRTPAPWDGDLRTDGQSKGQPGPGEGPTQDVPDRPRNTKDLRAEVSPKRTERHIPHSTKPPRHTGRGPPGRAAHSGQPPPTTQAHPRQAREGPCGPATGGLGAATATPEGATRLHPRLPSSTGAGPTAALARDTTCRSSSLLILRTLPSPRDTPPQRVHPRQQPEPTCCRGWHTVGPAPSTCGTGQMPSHPPVGPGRCVPAPRAVSAGTRAGLLTTWTQEPAGPQRTGGSAGEKSGRRSISSPPAALGSGASCLNCHFTSLLRA